MPRRRRRKRKTSARGVAGLVMCAVGALGLAVAVERVGYDGVVSAVAFFALFAVLLGVLHLWVRYRAHLRKRFRGRTLGELLVLSPLDFELAVADLLRELGYRNVVRVGRSGDLGADITCRDPKGRSVVVQCKRYAPGTSIGSPAIQHFIGMQSIHHGADLGIFVTTGGFSRPAVDLARQHQITLFDGEELSRLVLQFNSPKRRPVGAGRP